MAAVIDLSGDGGVLKEILKVSEKNPICQTQWNET
jgi:hypothetical protein